MNTDLIAASAAGDGLLVFAGGAWRLAIHVFKHSQGVVFVEPGWCNPDAVGKFYFHLVRGEITGRGPWRVGETPIDYLPEDHPLTLDWVAAKEYERTHKECSRGGCEAVAAREFPNN